MIFTGVVRPDFHVSVVPEERDTYRAHVAAKWASGEVVLIHIEEYRQLRSLQANNYYWGVVLDLIAQHTGHTPEQIHDAMCELFLPNEQKRVDFYNKMTGEQMVVSVDHRRSFKLTGGPFFDFVENVRQWARDFLQVETPDPDPEYWRQREPRKGRAA